MQKCVKCGGFLYSHRVYTHKEECCSETVCINCGWREWPQEILDQRAIARVIYSVNHKVKRRSSTY